MAVQLMLGALAVNFVMGTCMLLVLPRQFDAQSQQAFRAEAELLAQLVSELSGPSVQMARALDDPSLAASNLGVLASTKSIMSVVLFDENERMLGTYTSPNSVRPQTTLLEPTAASALEWQGDSVIVQQAMLDGGGRRHGWVQLHVRGDRLQEARSHNRLSSLYVTAWCGGVLFLGMLILGLRFARPIRGLTLAAEAVAAGRLDDVATLIGTASRGSSDELERLTAVFHSMVVRLQESRRHLGQQMDELEDNRKQLEASLQTLQATQRELVTREKMAGLGRLVAGVAHEINTPLGVSVTAASLLGEHIQRMGPSGLDPEFTTVFRLLEDNLKRSVGLVRKFKTVSVDQTGEQVRQIELGQYIRDVVDSLAPVYRHSPVTIVVSCPEPLELVTLPGAIAQIVTNLVTNAVTYAFEADETGTVTFELARDGERIRVCASDDGRGMSEEVAASVFEPFFTLGSQEGGSGLGLFIVHNLVTEALEGSIDLVTSPGQGTSFIIRFTDIKNLRAKAPRWF